jgi:3,4-dihydroxy 2-butanone 4-phosphate synthase/GTP cyclohydrolase II
MYGVVEEIVRARAPLGGRRRPFVTLAYARSLDGCLAASRGARTRLSGPESLQLTHCLRAEHEALIIGVDTVLVDDPLLTTRLVPGPSPLRVVLDSNLRTPPRARALALEDRETWIVCGPTAELNRERALTQAGARVVRAAIDRHGVSLSAVLVLLAEQGLRSVMVEGGARVLASFVRERRFDFVCVTIAPVEIGGERAVTLASDPLADAALRARRMRVGRDEIVCGPLGSREPT